MRLPLPSPPLPKWKMEVEQTLDPPSYQMMLTSRHLTSQCDLEGLERCLPKGAHTPAQWSSQEPHDPFPASHCHEITGERTLQKVLSVLSLCPVCWPWL